MLLIAAACLAAAGLAFNRIKHSQQLRMAEQARADGIAAYRAGNLTESLTQLSYYFEQRKDDLEVNLVFAEARSRSPTPGGRHLFEAVDLYTAHGLDLIDQQATLSQAAKESQRREILTRLLNLYAQLGDRLRVSQTADQLLAIDPNMIDALAAKAEVLLLGREFTQAQEVAQRLVELDPDSLTWRKMLLEMQSRQGAASSALVEQCRQWSEQYTADARFRLLTAAMLVEAGRSEDARAELHQAGVLSANSRPVLEQLVSLLDVLDLRDEADAALASSIARFPREWWPREVAIMRSWQGDEPERALEEFEKARAALGNPPPSVRRVQAVSLMNLGRNSEALQALEPLLSMSVAEKAHDVDRMWASAVAGVITMNGSDVRGVIEKLQMTLSSSPRDAVLQFLLGDVCLRAGERGRAIDAYQRAFADAPDWTAAGVACGNAQLAAGRLDEALGTAQRLITRSGVNRIQSFLLLARCHIALREAGALGDHLNDGDIIPDIIAALQQIRSQRPQDSEIATLLVRAHFASGDGARASDLLREAMADPNSTSEMLLALADVARQQLPSLEEPLLNQARVIGGLTVPVAFAQADLLARRSRFDDGLRLIDEVISQQRPEGAQLVTARCARAAYLLRMNDASAMPELMTLVQEHPDSLEVQRFVIAQPEAWSNQRMVALIMGNLRKLLGEDSVQVRLAEANFLIQHHSREPALLAKAVQSINSVLEQTPDSLAGLSLAAEAMLLGDRPNLERATAHLEHAVAVYPGEPSLLVRLISVLQRQGRYDAAHRYLQSLSQVLDAHPPPASDREFVQAELRLLQAQGDFETALVRAAAVVNAESPPSEQLLLASMQERTGKIAEAKATYQRLVDTRPDDAGVLSQAAEFYATIGDYERGLALVQRMPLPSPKSSRELMVGLYQDRHGRLDEAAESLKSAVRNNPRSPDAFNALARHYLARDQALEAREQAMAGLRVDPQHVGLRTTLAIANLALPGSDRTESIRLLRELGSDNDALLAMLQLLERTPQKDGRSAPSADNLAEARRLTTSYGLFLPVWQLAVSLHVEAGRTSEAIAIARDAVGRLPGEAQPCEWSTQLLIAAGRWSEALAEAQEWRRRTLADPQAADAATALSLIALDRSQEAAALILPHREKLLSARRAHPDRVLTLIEALVRSGEVGLATEIMTPLLDEDVRWRRAWIEAAGLMDAVSAERSLRQMAERALTSDERLALATQWLALGQRTESESHLQQADVLAQGLRSDPTTAVGALITIGAVAETRHDLAAAERAYRAALGSAPQNPVALNNLAFVLAQQSRDAEALPLIQKALTIQPDQPDFLDTLALVHRTAGRFDEAEQVLNRALDGRPDDPSLLLNLAQTQLSNGKTADASSTLSLVERRSAALSASLLRRVDELRATLDAAPDASQPEAENSAASGGATTKPTVP